ncbi:MAG: hypothetical protein ACRERV_11320, partial [Methylococcales bacterium]
MCKQVSFDWLYRSTNIHEISGKEFRTIICAGAPAQKWIANQDPLGDRNNIEHLISFLEKISCDTFILISTVDVFKLPRSVDETTLIEEEGLHAYGVNRRYLEKFIEHTFDRSLIVR